MTTLLFGPLNKFNTFQLYSIVLATKDYLLIRDNWNQETVVWHFQSTERKKKKVFPCFHSRLAGKPRRCTEPRNLYQPAAGPAPLSFFLSSSHDWLTCARGMSWTSTILMPRPPAPMFLFTYWLTVGMDRFAYLMTLVQSHLLIFLFWLVRSWKKMSRLLAPPPPFRIRRLGQENCMPHSGLLNPILRFAYFSIRDYLF